MTNKTNPATNFKMPIKAHMPVTVNFRAPINVNLTYNGAAEPSEPMEKVTSADLQRYIAERLQGQCETVPEGWPAPIKPVSKSSASNTTPASDAAKCNIPTSNTASDKPATSTSCGVAEASIDTLADSLSNQIDLYFSDLHKQIKEAGDPSSARAVARLKEILGDALRTLVKTQKESLETHLKFAQLRKNGF